MKVERLSREAFITGLKAHDRIILAKAITLVESLKPEDQQLAGEVINTILPLTGNSIRIGITGVPGVGKSTFIEAFGAFLIEQGKTVAVLTIDPSSNLTKGSILGDKTRMESLARNPKAFIRPSASGNFLGGTAGKTREAMLLCEAAGFDVILVETVGVGQSEVAVRSMVDFFLLLMLAGAGDELQGIKKGIMEMADGLVITKADGDNAAKATQAQADYSHALHLFPPKASMIEPKVLTCSATEGKGLDKVWKMISNYIEKTHTNGYFQNNRMTQSRAWFRESFDNMIKNDHLNYKTVTEEMKRLDEQVGGSALSPYEAARQLLKTYHEAIRKNT